MLWGQMSIWGHFHRQSTPSVMAKCLVTIASHPGAKDFLFVGYT